MNSKREKLKIVRIIATLIALLLVGCADSNGGEKQPLAPSPTPAVTDKTMDAPAAAELKTQTPATAIGAELTAALEATGTRIGDDLPVSRAMAAKMIALAFFSESLISSMDREIAFADTDESQWYDRYINAVFIQGCMKGSGDKFEPESALTLGQAETLVSVLDPEKKISFNVDPEKRSRPISYALWVDFYRKLLEVLEVQDMNVVNFVLLASAGNHSQLNNWHCISDIGPYRHAGINMDSYIDMRVQVLVKDSEIVSLLTVMDDKPVIRNAYIVKVAKDSITIFSGGAERAYTYQNALEDVVGSICDIQIEQGRALEVSLMPDNAGGHVMRASSTQIEIDEQVYLTDESFKVYSVADGAVKWKGLRDIIVGTDMALFFLNGTRAMAGVITKSVTPEKIRVVLQTTGYGGFVHQAVKIASSSSFTATQGQKTTNYSPGEVFDVSSMPKTGRIFLKADTAGAKFEIKSIARSWPSGESPKYSGAIEIGLEAGGYSIVNELSLEEYLYAVVPSEMPSSYGLEAAKVQAVTARSYAYNQFYQNRFHQYGANVDDSVNSQVYNNIPENETSIQAVDGTKGKVLSYNGAVVNANFFSTSAGVTANSGEVWAASQSEFPTYSTPYLSAKKQYTGKDYGDLSKEANAVAFFKAEGVHAFDSFSPWFRWTVEMSAEDLAVSINANIRARYDAAPALVKTLLEGGVFRSRPINTIGNLIDLEILSRGEAGNAMELKIIGDKATVLVKTEYNIRALLSPYKQSTPINVVRSDGSTVTNSKLLPSAFIAIEKASKGGTVGNVTIYGGGYGHGVGMSQNGVKGMIDQGYSFSQILEHFYPGTKIKSM